MTIPCIVFAYVFVTIIGHFTTAIFLKSIARIVKGNEEGEKYEWHFLAKDDRLNFFIGATERAIALTIILAAPKQLFIFIGGWIALKMAAYWQRFVGNTHAVDNQIAILGNAISFSFAIGVGVLLNPHAVEIWNAAN